MCVHTLFRKCRSCEMITIVLSARVQHALEPADAVDVEVVGRLVEQQDVRIAEQRLREQHAQLPARAPPRSSDPRAAASATPEAEQQFAGARLRPCSRRSSAYFASRSAARR